MFDMPQYIMAVHVIAVYTGVTSRFSVLGGNCVIIEDRLGTAARRTVSDGTYPVAAALTPDSGIVKIIVDSPDVSWSFTEDRGRRAHRSAGDVVGLFGLQPNTALVPRAGRRALIGGPCASEVREEQ